MYLSIHPSIRPSISSVHFARLFRPSISISPVYFARLFRPYVSSIYLSLFVYLCLSRYLSVLVSICLCLYQSMNLSVSVYITVYVCISVYTKTSLYRQERDQKKAGGITRMAVQRELDRGSNYKASWTNLRNYPTPPLFPSPTNPLPIESSPTPIHCCHPTPPSSHNHHVTGRNASHSMF